MHPRGISLAQVKQTKPRETERTEETGMKEVSEDVILIGKKPVMNYVVAAMTFFNAGAKDVVVKARGRAISTAIDTVELLRRAFFKDLEVKNIEIGTEEMARPEGQRSNVSTIEIRVARPGP